MHIPPSSAPPYFPINRRNSIGLIAGGILSAAFPANQNAKANTFDNILTVTGGNGDDPMLFTDAQLMELPQVVFETSTIWTEGNIRFSGPSLSAILQASGIASIDTGVRLSAINDYSVFCPAELIEAEAPIVANRINEQAFSVREKGPLWLVFPYDSSRRFRTETIFSVSVWQLTEISLE